MRQTHENKNSVRTKEVENIQQCLLKISLFWPVRKVLVFQLCKMPTMLRKETTHLCLRLNEQRSTRYHCWNHCTHLCSRTQVTKIWRNICNTKASLLLQILWGFSFEVLSPMKSEGGASWDIFFFLNLPCIILVKLNPSFWSKLYSLYLCPYCSIWSPPKVLQTFGHLLNLLLHTVIQLSFRTVPFSAPRVWDASHVILAPA